MKIVECTVDEMSALIELSSSDRPLSVGWGAGGITDIESNAWAIDELAKMRGRVLPTFESSVLEVRSWSPRLVADELIEQAKNERRDRGLHPRRIVTFHCPVPVHPDLALLVHEHDIRFEVDPEADESDEVEP